MKWILYALLNVDLTMSISVFDIVFYLCLPRSVHSSLHPYLHPPVCAAVCAAVRLYVRPSNRPLDVRYSLYIFVLGYFLKSMLLCNCPCHDPEARDPNSSNFSASYIKEELRSIHRLVLEHESAFVIYLASVVAKVLSARLEFDAIQMTPGNVISFDEKLTVEKLLSWHGLHFQVPIQV